ncbi:MAG: NifU family protein [Alphaproteobacteria bacterium]
MFIETETTPNPEVLSFRPHIDGGGFAVPHALSFTDKKTAAAKSPLAYHLFTIDGVKEVFLHKDFISIMKKPDQSWARLKPLIVSNIIDHLARGDKIISSSDDAKPQKKTIMHNPKDAETVEKIEELIETRIRPAVARDGGNIVLEAYDNGVVYLSMQGACSGCPSSTATLKSGIENMLKHFIPEVVEVRQAL